MKHDQRFMWLDLIRGLCAISVCAGHLRSAILADYTSLESTSLIQKALYLATGFGHQSVMVFFVLSGFFVGGAVLKNRDTFNWKKYAIARLSRLWVVLIPALLVTALVDQWLAVHAPDVLSGRYRGAWNSGPSPDEVYSASPATFFANVFFLQTVVAPVFGTNGPLWSLANEFWYYLLLPLCVAALGPVGENTKASTVYRLGTGALALAVLLWLPAGIVSGYYVWLLGLLAYHFIGRLTPRGAHAMTCIGVVCFGAALAYSKAASWQGALGVPSDLAVGGGFCVLCIALANLRHLGGAPSWLFRMARASSEFSYSLYLLHFPLVVLIASRFYRSGKLTPDAAGLSQFSFWLVALLAVCIVFWWLFERRTSDIRRWVVERMVHRLGRHVS